MLRFTLTKFQPLKNTPLLNDWLDDAATRRKNTLLLMISTDHEITQGIPLGQLLKIKLEIETQPPVGFAVESKYLLHPIPFAVRVYTLPDLFAGKMHAILCRKWKNRVKGRDWYDLVWFIANHPDLHLVHLEQRMRQSGHLKRGRVLDQNIFSHLLDDAIDRLDVAQARQDAALFVKASDTLTIWSKDFFRQISKNIRIV